MKKVEDNKKKSARPKLSLYSEINAHSWATKMEVKRGLSGKPDLKTKPGS
jgi:hypothetical protein